MAETHRKRRTITAPFQPSNGIQLTPRQQASFKHGSTSWPMIAAELKFDSDFAVVNPLPHFMAQPIFHASIEGAQHGAKSLADFLDYAKRSGASGAQPSNYMLQGGKLFKSAKEIKETF